MTKIEFASSREGKFKLLYQWWRGPVVVRQGPSQEQFHLFLWQGDDQFAHHFLFDRSPLSNNRVSGLLKSNIPLSQIPEEGEAKPQTTFNPTKETPSGTKLLDSGDTTIFQNDENSKKFSFKGSKLRGLRVFIRDAPGSNLWVMKRSATPADVAVT